MNNSIQFKCLDRSSFDLIEGHWERLRLYHRDLDWSFSHEMDEVQFADRRTELLEKCEGGDILLEVAHYEAIDELIGYCISSISKEGVGEIDSMYVQKHCRGQGIGEEFIRRAFSWFDNHEVAKVLVVVADSNESAFSLYKKCGFVSRTITMQRTEPIHGANEDSAGS